METHKILSMSRNVPTISKSVDINKMTSMTGGKLRASFFMLCTIPIVWCFDQNGGLATLGFTTPQTMEEHYKVRPDYLSKKYFAVKRSDVPALHHF